MESSNNYSPLGDLGNTRTTFRERRRFTPSGKLTGLLTDTDVNKHAKVD